MSSIDACGDRICIDNYGVRTGVETWKELKTRTEVEIWTELETWTEFDTRTKLDLYIYGVCSDEGLTLETSAKHHIPQATNIPYQPC